MKVDPVELFEFMREESKAYSTDGTPASNGNLVDFLAIAYAEQYGTDTRPRVGTSPPDLPTDQTNQAGNTPPSTDRGLWQLNSYWWSDVTDTCAFDWKCATKAVAKKTNGFRTSKSQWSTYNEKRHLYWTPLAWSIVRNVSCRDLRASTGAALENCKLSLTKADAQVVSLSEALVASNAMVDRLEDKIAAAKPALAQATSALA